MEAWGFSEGSKKGINIKFILKTLGLWPLSGKPGSRIGSVCQFPVILAYAITCHKSQGLTLPAVVVHSSKEFVPDLLYIAMSWFRSADTLQVMNFKENQILAADPEVINQCSRATGDNEPSLQCCRRKAIQYDRLFEAHDRFQIDEQDRGHINFQ